MGTHDTSILPTKGLVSTVYTDGGETGDLYMRMFLSRNKGWPNTLTGARPGSPVLNHIHRDTAPTISAGVTTAADYVIWDGIAWVDITDAILNAAIITRGGGVTTTYVDALFNGLSEKESVYAATIAALPTVTYANGTAGVGATLTASANGALTIDGVSPQTGARVLIKDQASGLQNGIYLVTAAGSAGAPFVLTRSLDGDASGDLNGAVIPIENGTLSNTSWFLPISTGAITVGTTSLAFVRGPQGSSSTPASPAVLF